MNNFLHKSQEGAAEKLHKLKFPNPQSREHCQPKKSHPTVSVEIEEGTGLRNAGGQI
jgi:hypothetical protein